MSRDAGLTTAELRSTFADVITAAGGTVSDTFDDGGRLFTRSILPSVRHVRPGDQVQGGVALRATEHDVWVHPYLFRQVCRNGAIMAHAIQTRHIDNLDWLPASEATFAVEEAIQACCADEVFSVAAEQMRSSREMEADLALNLLPHLSQLPTSVQAQVLGDILDRYDRERDQSRFGLMNAITSVARDTRDPELRWRLEELGGGVPVAPVPTPLPDDAAARLLMVG